MAITNLAEVEIPGKIRYLGKQWRRGDWYWTLKENIVRRMKQS